MSFANELSNHLKKLDTFPILFIGSGFSRRYMAIETWSALLAKMCTTLNLPRPYEYYFSNAEGNLPRVASSMGHAFNDIWWSEAKFEASRTAFGLLADSKYSPFKYEIAKYLNTKAILADELLQKELDMFKALPVDGIITTNWDKLIETLRPDFERIVGQEELIFSETYSIGEIYKIHGSTENPNSLVLTEEDYHKFEDRNQYLAAKLLTLFMEHPIIFIGYSLDDLNIQQILKSVIKCLTKEKVESLKDRLIFCQWNAQIAAPTIQDSSLLISDAIIPIKLLTIESYVDVFTIINGIKQRIPIKVLRKMKSMVYEYVKTADPKSKVFVSDDLENLEDFHDVEFVYGVGLKDSLGNVGIRGLKTRDLMYDIVIDQGWNSEKISKYFLPTLQGIYLPRFKHLRRAGFLTNCGTLDTANDVSEFTPAFKSKVNSVTLATFQPPESYRKKQADINTQYSTFSQLRRDKNLLHVLMYTPVLETSKIDLDELHSFLKSNVDKLIDSNYGTHYRKLICLYDFLRFRLP